MIACSENQVGPTESNDKDGDGLYQDQKVNYYLRAKKKYIYIYISELHHGNGTGYYLLF